MEVRGPQDVHADPELSVRWDQDHVRRVVRVVGLLDSRNVSHLQSAIVGLGNRELVIDLSDVLGIDDAWISALADLRQRLSPHQLHVNVDLASPAAATVAHLIPGGPLPTVG